MTRAARDVLECRVDLIDAQITALLYSSDPYRDCALPAQIDDRPFPADSVSSGS